MNGAEPRILVFDTPRALASAAARHARDEARAAVAARGRFALCLTGGSTPREMYETLARDADLRDAFPWAATDVFWGDERHVPPDHRDSNYGMAHEALLRHVPLDASRVHRMHGEMPDAGAAAADYERTLREALALGPGEPPEFDLLLLGVGPDAHIASLFPGSDALRERERLAIAPWAAHLDAWRITLAPPALVAARATAMLVAGEEKAEAVRVALEELTDPARWPVHLLRGARGPVTWFLDHAAASALAR